MWMNVALAAAFAASALAMPQLPTMGAGQPKGVGTPKGSPKGGGLGGLGALLGGGGASGGMGGLAQAMGFDPNSDITSMVCQTFSGTSGMGSMMGNLFGSPNGPGPDEKCMVDKSGGSGRYKANYTSESTLANHTIYAPVQPPAEKMPVILWANGFCMSAGTMFANFLNEIASHGFLIVANGPSQGAQLNGMTTYQDLIKSLDWVTTNPAVKKYGNIDTSMLAVAGQSCGGLEAYEASTDARVKLTVLFNSGYLDGSSASKMAKFKHPVAWFLGGAKDIAQKNGDADYKNMPAGTPALKASIEIGHIGTYYQKYGGKMGKGAVDFFSWQQKGDQSKKALFCNPSADSDLVKAGFKIESKNGFC